MPATLPVAYQRSDNPTPTNRFNQLILKLIPGNMDNMNSWFTSHTYTNIYIYRQLPINKDHKPRVTKSLHWEKIL